MRLPLTWAALLATAAVALATAGQATAGAAENAKQARYKACPATLRTATGTYRQIRARAFPCPQARKVIRDFEGYGIGVGSAPERFYDRYDRTWLCRYHYAGRSTTTWRCKTTGGLRLRYSETTR